MSRINEHRIGALSLLVAAGLGAGLGGCTLVAALDEPEVTLPTCEDGDVDTQRDLVVVMDSLTPHIGNYGEILAVSEGGFVTVRAVLDPVTQRDTTLSLAGALPPGPHHLDIFFDYNLNRVYDPPPADHAWSLPSCASGVYRFSHNPAFENIADPPPASVGEDLVLHLEGFEADAGKLLELRLVDLDAARPRTVGYYRLAQVSTGDATLALPGIVEPGTSYAVAVWVDQDADLTYRPPAVDHSWRVDVVGDATGIDLTLSAGADQAPIDGLLRGEP